MQIPWTSAIFSFVWFSKLNANCWMSKQNLLVHFNICFMNYKMVSDITKMNTSMVFIGLGRKLLFMCEARLKEVLIDPRKSGLSIGSLFQGEYWWLKDRETDKRLLKKTEMRSSGYVDIAQTWYPLVWTVEIDHFMSKARLTSRMKENLNS